MALWASPASCVKTTKRIPPIGVMVLLEVIKVGLALYHVLNLISELGDLLSFTRVLVLGFFIRLLIHFISDQGN